MLSARPPPVWGAPPTAANKAPKAVVPPSTRGAGLTARAVAPPPPKTTVGGGAGSSSSACSSLRAPTPPSPLLYPHDPLPPAARATAIAEVAPGALWTFTSPFYASPISYPNPNPKPKLSAENRMTVAKLGGVEDGSGPAAPFLALFNPLTPTAQTLEALRALEAETGAPVAAIVIPSTSPEHWVGAAGCAEAFPGAAILAPPGFFSGGPGGGRIGGKLGALKAASAVLDAAHASGRARELDFGGGGEGNDAATTSAAASLWGGQVGAALFAGRGGFVEVAFRLTATATVLTADLAFGLLPGDLEATPGANWLDKALARLAGVYGRLGCATWPVVRASPAEAAAFVGVLDGWRGDGIGVGAVIPAHLSAPWGGEALEDAFGWVKRGGGGVSE